MFIPVRETAENKVLPPASYSQETYSNNSLSTFCEVLNFQLSETSVSYFTAFWSEENSREDTLFVMYLAKEHQLHFIKYFLSAKGINVFPYNPVDSKSNE